MTKKSYKNKHGDSIREDDLVFLRSDVDSLPYVVKILFEDGDVTFSPLSGGANVTRSSDALRLASKEERNLHRPVEPRQRIGERRNARSHVQAPILTAGEKNTVAVNIHTSAKPNTDLAGEKATEMDALNDTPSPKPVRPSEPKLADVVILLERIGTQQASAAQSQTNLYQSLLRDIEAKITNTLNARDRELQAIAKIGQVVANITTGLATKMNMPPPFLEKSNGTSAQAIHRIQVLDDTLEGAIEALRIRSQAAERRADGLSKNVESVQKQLHESERERQRLQDDYDTLFGEHQQLGDDINRLRQDFGTKEQRLHADYLGQGQRLAKGLQRFWLEREEFYRRLHRGIGAEQGANLKRLKSFRKLSLEVDVALLEAVGAQLTLVAEALAFAPVPYDGALHRWHEDGETPVVNDSPATVFLPGWEIGDVQVKPSLGSQEVNEP